MLKFLYTLLHFVKVAVFKDRREYDLNSVQFNLRQLILFFLLVFLIFANIILARHTGHLQDLLNNANSKLEICGLKK